MSDNVTTDPFKEISLNWITGLSESKGSYRQSYNTIFTVINCLTKYALFILTYKNTSAIDFTELFFKYIEYQFSTPRRIIIDRDSRIISDFWKEVCIYKIIKRKMLIAFYPQTDNQSEALIK